MANATRYVINFAGQRQTINKSKITVLDLEPGRGAPLTSSTVLGWLGGSSSGLSASNISIVAMPASEFIGKLDDLVETYDMIYVGSDLTGFNTTGSGSSATTVYNDSTMNGLIYTNIGDVYKANILLAGLLDRDYYKISNGSNPTWSSGGSSYKYIDATSSSVANRFRFSGNDLTQLKAGELLDFAKSGYPVVIADNLTAGPTALTFRCPHPRAAASRQTAALCLRLRWAPSAELCLPTGPTSGSRMAQLSPEPQARPVPSPPSRRPRGAIPAR